MHLILFLAYSVMLAFGLSRIPFFKASGLSYPVLLLFFAIHVFTALLHNWIAYTYYPNHGDIWFFFNESLDLKKMLLADPGRLISGFLPQVSVFNPGQTQSFWGYLEYELMMTVNTLLDFFSADNLQINSLIFSFFVFWGNIALFRCLRRVYEDDLAVALLCLLVPSTLFWTSPIHKEGLLYLSLGFLFYYMGLFFSKKFSFRLALSCIFFGLLIFLCRSNILFILMPAFLVWFLAHRTRLSPTTKVVAAVFIPLLFFILPGFFSEHYSILSLISRRQMEFMQLHGHSRIYLPRMSPDLQSLLRLLPTALLNGFFQPTPGVGGNSFYWFFSVELLCIWALIAYTCLAKRHLFYRLGIFDYVCLAFCFSGILLIGCTVPFAGAIIRYRSLFLPFLTAPFLHLLAGTRIMTRCNGWLSKKLLRPSGEAS